MNTLSLSIAITKLAQINTKLISGIPLSKDEEALGDLVQQIAGQTIETPVVEPKQVEQDPSPDQTRKTRPPSPQREATLVETPTGFKRTGSNANYNTYSDGYHKIRRYNNTKFRGHLARILAETREVGRYDNLKLRLDEEVAPFPIDANLEGVIEWVTRIANHLNTSIKLYSPDLDQPVVIMIDNDKVVEPCRVYYDNNQFYHLISTAY